MVFFFCFFFSGCAVFLTVNTRPCARWKSSNIWTGTLRARPNAGRSLWSVSVQKKRNSHRSGRIRRHSRDCAWWGPWGLTGWRTLSGEKWGRSFTSWSLRPTPFDERANVKHLNLWLLIDLTEHLHSSFCCSAFFIADTGYDTPNLAVIFLFFSFFLRCSIYALNFLLN